MYTLQQSNTFVKNIKTLFNAKCMLPSVKLCISFLQLFLLVVRDGGHCNESFHKLFRVHLGWLALVVKLVLNFFPPFLGHVM